MSVERGEGTRKSRANREEKRGYKKRRKRTDYDKKGVKLFGRDEDNEHV
jgi:hypothetical protein